MSRRAPTAFDVSGRTHLGAEEERVELPAGLPLRLAIAGIVGAAIRIALVAATPHWSLTTDGRRFFDLAASAMRGTAFVPPLYPAFIRCVWLVFGVTGGGASGTGVAPVRLVQALFGGITVAATGALAARLAPDPARARHVGTLAAALAAVAPPLVFADIVALSEGQAALLLAGFLLLAERAGKRGSLPHAAAAGLLSGLAVLSRAPLLGWVLVRAAVATARPGASRRDRLVALTVLLAALGTVAPWTVRNAFLFGRLVPVSTNGGYNLWKSFHPACTGTEDSRGIDYSVLRGIPEGDLDEWGRRQAWGFVRDDPARAVRLAVFKEGYFWGLERLFAIGVRDGTWGPLPRWAVLMGCLALGLAQAVWLLCAPAGLAGARSGGLRADLLGLAGWCAAVHLVFIGEARYHAPLVPLFVAASAVTLAGGIREGIRGWSRTRLAALTLAAALPIAGFWAWELAHDGAAALRGVRPAPPAAPARGPLSRKGEAPLTLFSPDGI